MNFLPISILGYVSNGISTLIDKALLNKSLPSPYIYAFYINILGLVALFLIPFGVKINPEAIVSAVLAGIIFTVALLYYYKSLSIGEASVVAPIVGSLNPLFTLIIGAFFLNQAVSGIQLLSFFLLILGAVILTANLWIDKLKLNQQLLYMVVAGGSFGLSYIFLKQSFLASNFLTGLVISRLAGSVSVVAFLISPKIRSEIFSSKVSHNGFRNKTAFLMIGGQTMGALSGLLISYATSLAQPALVNSLFGVQYLVILVIALILSKRYPNLLGEHLTKATLLQKVFGAIIISSGVYLLGQ